MASYHLSIKSGGKGKAAEHAAYIEREGKYGKNEKRFDLIAKGYGNLPEWTHDNSTALWKMADRYERVNGATYREIVIALPRELSFEQHRELVDQFIRSEIGTKPYTFAIHSPTAALGDAAQPHAHIMFSDRQPDGIDRSPAQHFKRYNAANPELGGCRKDSGGKEREVLKAQLMATREAWADLQNSHLEKYGHAARVDHRSNRDRGIKQAPEKHLGHLGIKRMSTEDKAQYTGRRQNKQHQSIWVSTGADQN